jgi:hypothetical protein
MTDKKKKKGEAGLSLASIKLILAKVLAGASRYAGIMVFVLIAAVYGFVVVRINLLSNIQPSQSDIDAQTTKTSVPRIDPKVAEQLKQLEDNSVNVQTLFSQARNNPFE